jgi:hypothetical protein
MLPHFLPKSHVEQYKFKNYFMSQFKLIIKLPTCLVPFYLPIPPNTQI